MKKNVLLALALTAGLFASCSNSAPSLDGVWKFDDGSQIRFDTKKQSYVASGTDFSTKGNFQSTTGGSLIFNGEEMMTVLSDRGFEINYGGDYILFEGKEVSSIEQLNGKYKSEDGMVFDFNNKTGKLRIVENKIESTFDYKTTSYSAILFTSGDYAYGQAVEMNFIDKNHLKLDEEILTRN